MSLGNRFKVIGVTNSQAYILAEELQRGANISGHRLNVANHGIDMQVSHGRGPTVNDILVWPMDPRRKRLDKSEMAWVRANLPKLARSIQEGAYVKGVLE